MIEHLLVHSVDVLRPVAQPLGRGNFRDELVSHLVSIKFRLASSAASEAKQAKQRIAKATHTGHALPGTDIKIHDVITNVIRETGETDTEHYRVLWVHRPSLAHHLRVSLEQIQKAPGA
jgi:hypothetical protein